MGIRSSDIGRLLATYSRKRHDRPPHFDFIDPKNVDAILGKSVGFRNDVIPDPRDAVELARRTCQDYVLVQLQYWPVFHMENEERIGGWSDLERLRSVDMEDVRRKIDGRVAAVQGTNLGVGVDIALPFFSCYMSVGPIPIQSFMLLLYDDLSFVQTLMDIQLQNQLAILEEIKDRPIAFVEIADDICDNNGFMVDRRFISELWIPRAERLLAAVRSLKVPIQWHCCGKLDDVIPLLIHWGVSAVAPVQPKCNDIYALKRRWGHDICLVGNINIEGVLAFGSECEVYEDTKKHIEGLSRDGGYVLGSSHSIVDAVPTKNYLAMLDCLLTEGGCS